MAANSIQHDERPQANPGQPWSLPSRTTIDSLATAAAVHNAMPLVAPFPVRLWSVSTPTRAPDDTLLNATLTTLLNLTSSLSAEAEAEAEDDYRRLAAEDAAGGGGGNNWTQLALYGVVMPVVAIVGVLLNAASLVVLTRKSMRSSVNVYLAGLSLFDGLLLLVVLSIFPPFSYCEVLTKHGDSSFWCSYATATFQLTYPLMNIMQTGSIWTVTAITVDRFLAIIYPLKSREYLTILRATVVLTVVLGWSTVYNIPSFFELERVNNTLELTSLRKDYVYITVYKSYSYLFLMFVIPASLMITLNSLVTVAVRRAYKVRKQMSGKEEKERRSTVMAILVVSSFLVLNLTSNITNCVEAFAGVVPAPLVWTGNLLVTVNSTVNFFIYCALSVKFRQMFCKLFCPLCYTPERQYRYLSTWFRGCGPGGDVPFKTAGRFERGTGAAGIVSMRSLRRPLISRHHGGDAHASPQSSPVIAPTATRAARHQPSGEHRRASPVGQAASRSANADRQHPNPTSRV